MKKNFLVTTGLIDTWEFEENNFLLGRWCEFYEFSDFEEKKFNKKILKKDNIIKSNIDHWANHEKRNKYYEYLEKKVEYLLEVISEKLSAIHNVNENKEYWRVVVYGWLHQYATIIFDKWEIIKIFFEKNKTEKFYSNFISLKDLDFVPKNHQDFGNIILEDEWNHMIILRLFYFLNIQNLSLLEKKRINFKKKTLQTLRQNSSITTYVLKLIDSMISKLAFKFNKIILESFYFPKKEYLKICLRCKLIPSRYSNIFEFNIKENNPLNDNKRIEFKNLLSKVHAKDKFIQFLLQNIHKDIPKSYLENFDAIKKKNLPFAKKRKTIFSMHSVFMNDYFKIYLAETKKVGSKFIIAPHGGGLVIAPHGGGLERKSQFDPHTYYLEKVSDKIISWYPIKQKENIYVNLSPTLPLIKLKNNKVGSDCSIILFENKRYLTKFPTQITSNQLTDVFNTLSQFVRDLNPEIRSKIKFRTKGKYVDNSEKRFSEMFGKESVDKVSSNRPFKNIILNSKLIIVAYPETAFSEAMYSNTPTVLIIKKNHWQFSKAALQTFNVLKENKIAFDDFNEARIHINEYWKEIETWWKCKNVQSARKIFLTNFFNVKPDWYREWSDYIHSSLFPNNVK